MSLHISYDLEGNGWSTCWMYVNGKRHEIGITHVFSDPIEDCMMALLRIIKGGEEAYFIWYNEPGGEKILLREIAHEKHKIKVCIEEFQASFGEEIKDSEKVLEFTIEKRLFIKMFYYEFKKLVALLEEKNYAKNRNADFPFTPFKMFEKKVMAYL